MGNKPAGGIGSRVVRNVGVKTGQPSRKVNPGAVGQFGSQMGNHSTDGKSVLRNPAMPLYAGVLPGVGSVPLGNQTAQEAGQGPGAGRTNYGKAGMNGSHGPVNPGQPTKKRRSFE
jgi:hypothetical protein